MAAEGSPDVTSRSFSDRSFAAFQVKSQVHLGGRKRRRLGQSLKRCVVL